MPEEKVIQRDFYLRDNVSEIARELIGKILYSKVNNMLTAGMIVETEAYCGKSDRASHAYPDKKTRRNAVMFEEGGVAYVYFIYGIHYMFNIVTNIKDYPDAILVRALEPSAGVDIMMSRRNKLKPDRLTSGPGSLCEAMGINMKQYGVLLDSQIVWLEHGKTYGFKDIIQTTRIGVKYAGVDALLPWRFYLKGNPWISKPSRSRSRGL